MGQPFRALLAEQDEEFVYNIETSRALHDDDVFERLRIGLLGYDLRSLERVDYDPLAAPEPMFRPFRSESGHLAMFRVKAVLGNDIPAQVLLQQVSYFTDINWEFISVNKEGDSEESEDTGAYKSLAQHARDWNATPDFVDGDAQQWVGQDRLDAFMKELDADRSDREKEVEGRNVQPELTEAFVTSHLALGDVYGQYARKGFYLVERYQDDPSLMHIQGPFTKQPTNYPFISNLMVKGCGVFEAIDDGQVRLVEHDRDFRFTRPLRERQIPQPYQVTVQDQQSGKEYTVLVKAISETDARDAGVTMVAQQEKLNPQNLIAVEPHAVS